MAVTQVGIVNQALIQLGAATISSINQDIQQAILAKAIYDLVRDEVQSEFPWSFTKSRQTISPNATTPAWGYDYQYDFPTDALALWEVDPDDLVYVVENRQILTDESELNVLFGIQNTDESSWTATFANAMSWKMSEKLSYSIKQSLPLTQFCAQMYKVAIEQARWKDSLEGPLQELVADKWTNSRL